MNRNTVQVLSLIVSLGVGACGQQPPEECLAAVQQRLVDSLIAAEPLEAMVVLEPLPKCDATFAASYLAEERIAAQAEEGYYYGNQVRPRGSYDQRPGPNEEYVLAHVERFQSATEGTAIRPTAYWLDQLVNRHHPVIGRAALKVIEDLDAAVWEDGDGTAHTQKLLDDYWAWLEMWRDHPASQRVRKRIAQLEEIAA